MPGSPRASCRVEDWGHERVNDQVRQSDTRSPGKNGKQESFRQLLLEETGAAGTERGSNSPLLTPARTSRQNQVGGVGAGDCEYPQRR
jgi:hypothetical protein